jgi:hypothetical protein
LVAKSGGGGGKKISPYNKFVQQELARLKADDPDMPHTERYVIILSCVNQFPQSFPVAQIQARRPKLEEGEGEP